jgi:hypothetical protein
MKAMLLAVFAVSAFAQTGAIRVNAGGPSYTDAAGNQWSADTGAVSATGQYSTSAAIASTPDATLYQTESYSPSGALEYHFTVPNGSYSVTLKYAEIFFTSPGQRVFGVTINGTQEEPSFDPFAAAGGENIAVDKTYSVSVSDGALDIQLTPITQNPKISAIDIEPIAATPPPVAPPDNTGTTADDIAFLKAQCAALAAAIASLTDLVNGLQAANTPHGAITLQGGAIAGLWSTPAAIAVTPQ